MTPNNERKKLIKIWTESIYYDAWIAQCEAANRKPKLSDLRYIGTITGVYGDYMLWYDSIFETYICEYDRRD